MKLLFWISFSGLFYIYLGYPVLIWILSRLFPHPVRKGEFTGTFSVVIVAHNEEANIRRKVESILACKGLDRMEELVVASDGSTDRTVELIAGLDDAAQRGTSSRIRAVEFKERRGKSAVLNDVVPACQSDIVILTDARQDLHPDALTCLLENFADPGVGVVSGELVFIEGSDTTTARGMGAYWNYEKSIRKAEARFDSVPGATGALYALRRALYTRIPEEALVDDVVIPMKAVMGGYRCIFEERAIVYDQPSRTAEQERIRKRRTIAGIAQLARLFPGWLLPGLNPIWPQYISHKMLRLISPVLLLLMLASSIILRGIVFYRAALLLQALFYLGALAGMCLPLRRLMPVVGPASTFVALNIATFQALGDSFLKRHDVRWIKGSETAGSPSDP